MPAILYLRISQDRVGDEAGVTRQREDAERLARARGLEVVDVLTDNDQSALRSAKRPGFERLMELIGAGAADTVVAWSFERVLKTRTDQLRFIEQGQVRGVRLILVRGAELDMSTPGGRLLADILASIARNETELKSDRQKRANRQRAEQGLPHVARRAFGYEPSGMEIREDEAELVRQMVERLLSGWTVRDIVRWLNDAGHRSTDGKDFTIKVVKDHLTSARNAGLRVYEGQSYPAVWPGIIDVATRERVLAEFERRKGASRSETPLARKYLLTGLLYCGRCGAPMVGHAKKDPRSDEARPKYVCPSYPHGAWCGNNTRLSVPLDHLVTEALLYRLDTDALARLLQGEGAVQAVLPLDDRDRLRARLDQLLDDYADGTLTKPEFTRARQRVQNELDAVEAEIAAIYASQDATRMLSAGESVRAAWEREPVAWRQRLMKLMIERVVVQPSRKRPTYYVGAEGYRFDWNSVEISWLV
jgi:DNA invertase Pin-like site-specific DNA recombinase